MFKYSIHRMVCRRPADGAGIAAAANPPGNFLLDLAYVLLPYFYLPVHS